MNSVKILLTCMLLLFSGCIGFQRSAQKTGGEGTVYESFFVNDSTMQYFISPLAFEGDAGELSIDFTFRKIGDRFTDVTANFSIFSDSKFDFREIDFPQAVAPEKFTELKLLYKEKEKKAIHYRYTSKISWESFEALLNQSPRNVEVNDLVFGPKKKTVKALDYVRDNVVEFL